MIAVPIDVDMIRDIELMLKNLTGYELLSYAICNEECAAEIYEWLAERLGGKRQRSSAGSPPKRRSMPRRWKSSFRSSTPIGNL